MWKSLNVWGLCISLILQKFFFFFFCFKEAHIQLAFYVNLHRAVIGPSATLTGRWRPDIDLRRMLTGIIQAYSCPLRRHFIFSMSNDYRFLRKWYVTRESPISLIRIQNGKVKHIELTFRKNILGECKETVNSSWEPDEDALRGLDILGRYATILTI